MCVWLDVTEQNCYKARVTRSTPRRATVTTVDGKQYSLAPMTALTVRISSETRKAPVELDIKVLWDQCEHALVKESLVAVTDQAEPSGC